MKKFLLLIVCVIICFTGCKKTTGEVTTDATSEKINAIDSLALKNLDGYKQAKESIDESGYIKREYSNIQKFKNSLEKKFPEKTEKELAEEILLCIGADSGIIEFVTDNNAEKILNADSIISCKETNDANKKIFLIKNSKYDSETDNLYTVLFEGEWKTLPENQKTDAVVFESQQGVWNEETLVGRTIFTYKCENEGKNTYHLSKYDYNAAVKDSNATSQIKFIKNEENKVTALNMTYKNCDNDLHKNSSLVKATRLMMCDLTTSKEESVKVCAYMTNNKKEMDDDFNLVSPVSDSFVFDRNYTYKYCNIPLELEATNKK